MRKYSKVTKETFEQAAGSSLGFTNYVARLKLDYSDQQVDPVIDYCNELKLFHTIGGSGGTKESTAFGLCELPKRQDKQRKSKLDFSKHEIRLFLFNNFNIEMNSAEMIEKSNLILSILKQSKSRNEINKLAFISNNKIAFKPCKEMKADMYTLKGVKLDKRNIIINQINFVIWLHSGYSISNVNLNDLKSDLIYYWLTEKNDLFSKYRASCKRYMKRYNVNYHVSFARFIFRKFKIEFRTRINSYLYQVNLPYAITHKFNQKSKDVQKKSKVNLFSRSKGLRFSSYYVITTKTGQRIAIDGQSKPIDRTPIHYTVPTSLQTIGDSFYRLVICKQDTRKARKALAQKLEDFRKYIQKEQKIIDLKIFNFRRDGYTIADIAYMLDLSESYVKHSHVRTNVLASKFVLENTLTEID